MMMNTWTVLYCMSASTTYWTVQYDVLERSMSSHVCVRVLVRIMDLERTCKYCDTVMFVHNCLFMMMFVMFLFYFAILFIARIFNLLRVLKF